MQIDVVPSERALMDVEKIAHAVPHDGGTRLFLGAQHLNVPLTLEQKENVVPGREPDDGDEGGGANGLTWRSERDYVLAVSGALRGELGTTGAATKMVMRWTGACERTARTWMTGAAGPSGHYLMSLAHESDAVLAAILTMTSRPELGLAADLYAAEVAIAKASRAFEELRRRTVGDRGQ